jgi:hypothetical protein
VSKGFATSPPPVSNCLGAGIVFADDVAHAQTPVDEEGDIRQRPMIALLGRLVNARLSAAFASNRRDAV